MTKIHLILGAFVTILIAIGFNNCGEMEPLPKATQSSTGNNNPPPPGGTVTYTGPTYFTAKVKPAFNKCMTCHIEGAPASPAPQTIWDYNAMKAKITVGSQYSNNLLNKVRSVAPFTHDGGNQCSSAAWQTESPCKELIVWWSLEGSNTQAPPPNTGLALKGGIEYNTVNGLISGHAADSAKLNDVVSVTFYINGAKGTGTMLGTVSANLQDFDPNYPGHLFVYQLPAAYLDGRPHNIYAYGKTNTVAEILLLNTFFVATSYAKSATWNTSNVFNNIRTTCNSCHTLATETVYDMVANPIKAKGGTATNNDLYRFAANVGGTHSGGNVCNVGNVCQNIPNYWNQEFAGYP